MRIRAAANNFFFNLHTSTLPVKTWLHSRRMFVLKSVGSRLCNQPETVDYCLVFCRDDVFFWDVLRALKKFIDITPIVFYVCQ